MIYNLPSGDSYNKHHQLQGAYIAEKCSEDSYVGKILSIIKKVKTVSHDLKLAIQ